MNYSVILSNTEIVNIEASQFSGTKLSANYFYVQMIL